eukprot:6196588-Pleurochrysis_carterae.AAC.3
MSRPNTTGAGRTMHEFAKRILTGRMQLMLSSSWAMHLRWTNEPVHCSFFLACCDQETLPVELRSESGVSGFQRVTRKHRGCAENKESVAQRTTIGGWLVLCTLACNTSGSFRTKEARFKHQNRLYRREATRKMQNHVPHSWGCSKIASCLISA